MDEEKHQRPEISEKINALIKNPLSYQKWFSSESWFLCASFVCALLLLNGRKTWLELPGKKYSIHKSRDNFSNHWKDIKNSVSMRLSRQASKVSSILVLFFNASRISDDILKAGFFLWKITISHVKICEETKSDAANHPGMTQKFIQSRLKTFRPKSSSLLTEWDFLPKLPPLSGLLSKLDFWNLKYLRRVPRKKLKQNVNPELWNSTRNPSESQDDLDNLNGDIKVGFG